MEDFSFTKKQIDILRFRRYFGEQFINKENFIESLTVDNYIIQIPYLSERRMNIHKFKKSLDKEISSKPVDLLLSIFSPVTYYQPKEEIVYIVFALKKPTKALNAILVSPINKDADNFTEIEEKELNFSEEGIAIVRFSGHPVGEYQAVIAEKYRKEEDDYIAFGSYIYVVEYRQSLLTSEVVNHKTENGKMYIELQVKRPDGSLYTGKLFAMYNNFSSLPIENSDGNFSIIVPEFFYDMKSIERERANIQLSDEYGNCCEIQFNETGSSSKFDIRVFHDYHNMAQKTTLFRIFLLCFL